MWATIPALGMPTRVHSRVSSEEVGHFGSGHERDSGEGFGERRRLRLAGTQPTREDTLCGHRFAVLHEEEVEAPVAHVSDETSESRIQSSSSKKSLSSLRCASREKTIFRPRSFVLTTSTSRRCSRPGPRS